MASMLAQWRAARVSASLIIIVGLAEVVQGALPIRSPPCKVVQKPALLDECRGVTILSGTISDIFDWGVMLCVFSVFFLIRYTGYRGDGCYLRETFFCVSNYVEVFVKIWRRQTNGWMLPPNYWRDVTNYSRLSRRYWSMSLSCCYQYWWHISKGTNVVGGFQSSVKSTKFNIWRT